MILRRAAAALVASLARPGGSLTGVTALGHVLNTKRLELIKEAVPGIARVAVASVLMLPIATQAADTPAAPRVVTRERIDAVLPELEKRTNAALASTGVPGLSIAIVYRDQVLYAKGFGLREAGKPERVDADTVFQLASVSKPVASTVVSALVGRRVVAWDDPVVTHDPRFALSDPWVTQHVTFADLFSHRSGLADHAGDDLEDNGFDRAYVLGRLRQLPLAPFRAVYAYTNFGLTAAAQAAATAYGKSWEDTSAEVLYRPLGMRATSSRFADFMSAPNRAAVHVLIDGTWIAKFRRQPDAQSPAGGVSSSARDMAQFLRLHLARGTVDGRQLVDAKALDQTHYPVIVSGRAPTPDRSSDFYGLGWGVGYDAFGRVRWSHSGAFGVGAATNVTVLPAQQLGIVVLSNAQPIGVPEAIVDMFLDLLQKGSVNPDVLTIWRGRFATLIPPAPTPPATDRSKPARPSAAYVGTYANTYFGDLQVVERDGGLRLVLGPDKGNFPLEHVAGDVFAYMPAMERAESPTEVLTTFGGAPIPKAYVRFEADTVHLENYDSDGLGTFKRR